MNVRTLAPAVAALLAAAMSLASGIAGATETAGGADLGYRTAVVGGADAPDNSWPFIAALIQPGPGGDYQNQFCGGSLIAATWVLTAAHCVESFSDDPGSLRVVIGRQDLDSSAGDARVARSIHVYPGFDTRRIGSPDMALIELSQASSKSPIRLMTSVDEPQWDDSDDDWGVVAGWGSRSPSGGNDYPSRLQSALVPIWSDSSCSGLTSVYSAPRHQCAGDEVSSACFGDSGGPLLTTDTKNKVSLVGVVSFGGTSCDRPSVFNQTTYYQSWIRDTMSSPATTTTTTRPTTTTTRPTTTTTRPSGSGGGSSSGGATASDDQGYSVVAANGGIFNFGDAGSFGSPAGAGTCAEMTNFCFDIAAPIDSGYWVSTSRCDIQTFGPVETFPSPPTDDPCYLAATPSGRGLWALTTTGHVFTLGDAASHGEYSGHVNGAWLHLEPTPNGHGYWLVGNDGGIFTFGSAGFFGSTGALVLNKPIVSMASTPSGRGYWLVAADGGIFTFGDAAYYGSTGAINLGTDIVAMVVTPSGRGYWLYAKDGRVFAFGDARNLGSANTGGSPIMGAVAR